MGIMLSGIVLLVGIYFIFIIGIFMKKFRRPTIFLSWLIGCFYFIYIPFLIIVLAGGYDIPEFHGATGSWASLDVTDKDSIYACLIIVLLILSLLLTAHIIFFKYPKQTLANNHEINYRILTKIYLIALALVVIVWAIKIYLAGGIFSYLFSYWYTRGSEGLENYSSLWLIIERLFEGVYIAFCAIVALIIYDSIEKNTYRYWLLISAILTLLIGVIMSGNRIHLILIGLYAFPAIFLYRRKLLIPIGVLAPLVIVLGSYWANIRGFTNKAEGINIYTNRIIDGDVDFLTPILEIFEGANILALIEIIKSAGYKFDIVLGETYSKAVTWLIPRSIWPEKPLSATQAVADIIEPDTSGWSVSFTQFGEIYYNFGIASLILLPLFTILLLAFSNYFHNHYYNSPLKSVSGCLLTFWMARSIFSDNLVLLLFTFIIIWGFGLEKHLYYSTSSRGISSRRI